MSYGFCYDATGSKCSGRAQPGTVALRSAVRASRRFGVVGDLGIYNCRPTRGGSTLSTHGEGRGWDAAFNANNPTQKAFGDAFAAWLVANAQTLGVQRVIWNRRQWDSKTRKWRAYSGVSPHTDHVHSELCWASARTLTVEMVRAILGTEEDWLMALTEAEQKELLQTVRDTLGVKQGSRLDARLDGIDERQRDIQARLKAIEEKLNV